MTTPTPYGQQDGIPPAGAPGMVVARRPALTPRAKRGAAIAGGVGFNILTFGFGLFITPIAIALIGGILSLATSSAARGRGTDSLQLRQLRDFLERIDLSAWTVPLVLASVIGLAMMVVAILTSKSILRSHEVNNPWGVTWAGAGVGIVGFWFVSWIPGILVQILSGILRAGNVDTWVNVGISGAFSLVIGIVANAVIGWLAWWWMAHAMRPDTVPAGQRLP